MNRQRHEFVITTVILLTMFALLVSCSSGKTEEKEEKIENVVRIVMHKPYYWTLIVQLPNSNESKLLEVRPAARGVRVIADVPSERMMWVFIKSKNDFIGDSYIKIMELHVHSPKDINAAG